MSIEYTSAQDVEQRTVALHKWIEAHGGRKPELDSDDPIELGHTIHGYNLALGKWISDNDIDPDEFCRMICLVDVIHEAEERLQLVREAIQDAQDTRH